MFERLYRKEHCCEQAGFKQIWKHFVQFMSNVSFGKTMENLRKRSRIKFVSNPQRAETFAQRATFKSFQIKKQDLISVLLKNSVGVVSTKPTHVGASFLDLFKLSLYKFYYEEKVPRQLDTRQINWKLPPRTQILSYIKYRLRISTKPRPPLGTCLTSPTIQNTTICTIQLTKKFS